MTGCGASFERSVKTARIKKRLHHWITLSSPPLSQEIFLNIKYVINVILDLIGDPDIELKSALLIFHYFKNKYVFD
jgi:hypothetical protein